VREREEETLSPPTKKEIKIKSLALPAILPALCAFYTPLTLSVDPDMPRSATRQEEGN
jgi:hypothetical protein